MTWTIKISETAFKQLRKIDKIIAARIINFLEHRIAELDNTRHIGEALKGDQFGEYWKYRVGYYRIICDIVDEELTILTLQVSNCREVYR